MSDERYERTGEIFWEAVQRSGAERSAYLDDTCGNDLELRSAVDALIAADDDESSPVNDTAPGIGLSLLANSMIADTIGDYAIIRVMGQGGMGRVYEAQQKNPARRVALKVMRPGLASEEMVRRFEREAALLGRLEHPGIARIYDAGSFDAGDGAQPFMAMEFVDGSSLLRATIDQPLNDRIQLMAQICDAIHYAHQRGIIHRDLKPENILIDGHGAPRILDFGVARVLDIEDHLSSLQTTPGQVVGTLTYMSPEQVTASEALDTRTDVYSLGAILFELLSGELPHALQGLGLPAAARIVVEDDPTSLSSIDSALRGDLDTIVAKALEKDPERRYDSAAELAADLRRYLKNEPISARPASTLYQLRKFTRRHRTLVFGVVGIALAIVVGAIVSLVFALSAEQNAAESAWATYRMSVEMAMVRHLAGDDVGAASALEQAPEEHRSWEWRYIRGQLDRVVPTRSIARPRDEVARIAFRADGTPIAAIAYPDHIGIFDLTTGDKLTRVGTGEAPLPMRSISPDGAMLVSGPGPVIWDTATGARLADLSKGERRACGISPDGATVAWTTAEGSGLVDVATGIERGSYIANARAVFSHDGTRVAWFGINYHAPIAIADTATGDVIVSERLDDGPGWGGNLVWSPSGAMIAVTMPASTAVLKSDTLRVVRRIPRRRVADHLAGSRGIAFIGETHLVRAEKDGLVTVVDLSDRSTRPFWKPPRGVNVFEVVVSPDRKRVAVGGRGWALLHHLDEPDGSRQLVGHTNFVYVHAWSPDGAVLATAGWDGTIRLWDGVSGAPLAVLPAAGAGNIQYVPGSLYFTDGGRRLEVIERWFSQQVWDLVTGDQRVDTQTDRETYLANGPPGITLVGTANSANCIAVSADGRLVARVVPDGVSVRVRATNDEIRHLDVDAETVGFSPDATRLVTASASGVVRLWDTVSGALLATAIVQQDEIFCAAFSSDGSRVALSGQEGIQICDATTLEVLLHLDSHDDYVRAASFSPDGTRLASVSGDFTARIWDTVPHEIRRAQIEANAALRERMTPLVDRLRTEFADGHAVANAIDTDDTLNDEERQAALFVLMLRVLATSPRSQ